ncbi:hypothetical protein HC762_01985, partial [bacterium]|nr:hypothetical protein [bacterium]
PRFGKIGKQRSTHNNYLTLPVLLMMVSPHYGFLSAGSHTWLVVALIFVAGALVRHYFNRMDAGDDCFVNASSRRLNQRHRTRYRTNHPDGRWAGGSNCRCNNSLCRLQGDMRTRSNESRCHILERRHPRRIDSLF